MPPSPCSSLTCPEDADALHAIQDEYSFRFSPRDQPEHDLVEEIVFKTWQMRQAWMHEIRAINLQMELDMDGVQKMWLDPSNGDRRTLAYIASLEKGNAIALFQRYATTMANRVERAIKLLAQLREDPTRPSQLEDPTPARPHLPNEPTTPPNPPPPDPKPNPKSPPQAHTFPRIFAYGSPSAPTVLRRNPAPAPKVMAAGA